MNGVVEVAFAVVVADAVDAARHFERTRMRFFGAAGTALATRQVGGHASG